jgi:type IV secretory pathway TraG/TraD family ATPase VirD4
MRLSTKHIFFLLGVSLAIYIGDLSKTTFKELYLISCSVLLSVIYLYFSLSKKNDVPFVSSLFIWFIYSMEIDEFKKYSLYRVIYLATILLFVIIFFIDFLFFRKDIDKRDRMRIFYPNNWL